MDGTFTFRSKGEPAFGASLPCTSVDTVADAEMAQAALCRLQYDGRHVMAGFLERARSEGVDALQWAEAQIQEILGRPPTSAHRHPAPEAGPSDAVIPNRHRGQS